MTLVKGWLTPKGVETHRSKATGLIFVAPCDLLWLYVCVCLFFHSNPLPTNWSPHPQQHSTQHPGLLGPRFRWILFISELQHSGKSPEWRVLCDRSGFSSSSPGWAWLVFLHFCSEPLPLPYSVSTIAAVSDALATVLRYDIEPNQERNMSPRTKVMRPGIILYKLQRFI